MDNAPNGGPYMDMFSLLQNGIYSSGRKLPSPFVYFGSIAYKYNIQDLSLSDFIYRYIYVHTKEKH